MASRSVPTPRITVSAGDAGGAGAASTRGYRLPRPLPIERAWTTDREAMRAALRVVLGLPRALPGAWPGGQ